MECFYGMGGNDLLVPDNEMFLESWMQWGRIESENMESLNSCFAPGESLAWESDMAISASHFSDSSCGTSTLSQGIQHQNTVPLQDQTSYRVDDGKDAVDDMILTSFLEEDLPSMESLHGSFGFPPEFQCGLPYDSLTSNILDSRRVPDNSYGIRSSEHLQPEDFSQSGFGEMTECSSSHCTPYNLGKKPCCPILEVPSVNVPLLLTQCGATDEETSLEESVLHELNGVMAELTQKTRICFRDSLYRLANNSKQHDMVNQDHTNVFTAVKFPEAVLDQSSCSRSETRKAMELKTSVIDSVIANLMFNNTEVKWARPEDSFRNGNLTTRVHHSNCLPC